MQAWGRVRDDRRVWLGAALAALSVIALVILLGTAAPPEAADATPVATALARPPAPSPTPSPSPTPTPRATPRPSPTTEARGDDRYTVLVLGSDSDSVRRARGSGGLTDAITVLSVAADGSDVVLVSLPRDTSDLPMPDGSVWTRKANAIAPTHGPAAMRDAMGLLLGIPIDHYAMIDMDDFRGLVDAVGGVTVHVPYPLSDNRCTIGAGTQHLGGSLALCYARHRAVDSDYARAGRHQQLLLAIRDRMIAGALDPAAVVASLGSLQTDIPAGDIPMLVDLAIRAQSAQVRGVVLGPEYMSFAGIAGTRGWISVPDVGLIRGAVTSLIGEAGTSVDAAPTDDASQRPPRDARVE